MLQVGSDDGGVLCAAHHCLRNIFRVLFVFLFRSCTGFYDCTLDVKIRNVMSRCNLFK